MKKSELGEYMRQLAAKVNQLLRRNNILISDLCYNTGIEFAHLWAFVHNDKRINADEIKRIGEFLKFSPERYITESDKLYYYGGI